MPITLDIKKDVQEAVMEAIAPLLRKMNELENQINKSNDKFLTEKEVIEITKKSASTIRRHMEQGIFPSFIRDGKRKKWRRSDIMEYMKKN